MAKSKHGGKRKGAGRKPASLPFHLKKFRASDKDWQEFLSYLTGDAKADFLLILTALKLLYESMGSKS
jgi:hypothetical protein